MGYRCTEHTQCTEPTLRQLDPPKKGQDQHWINPESFSGFQIYRATVEQHAFLSSTDYSSLVPNHCSARSSPIDQNLATNRSFPQPTPCQYCALQKALPLTLVGAIRSFLPMLSLVALRIGQLDPRPTGLVKAKTSSG